MSAVPFDHPGLEVTVGQIVADDAQGTFVLVDVREPHEWEAGRIDGAVHIPMTELEARTDELDPAQTIVFQCLVGGRSAIAASAFREIGYDAWSLAGGIEAWVAEGRSLVPDGGVIVGH